jgi:CheY-like chemotaxis protein
VRKVPPLEATDSSRLRVSSPADTLLYVEDDDANWEVADYRLSKAYTMVRAATSEAACQILRERGRALSAILMDIELRGSDLNGIELTELFRGKRLSRDLPAYARNLPPVTQPIIFVTAHGARYTDVQLMLFGADKVILKPIDFTALHDALTSLQLARAPRRT